MRAGILSAFFVASLALPVEAQVCFRARPKPECSTFFLTEASVSYRMAAGSYSHLTFGRVRPSSAQGLWEFGFMGNAGTEWAVGVGGFVAWSDEGTLTGWRLRGRKWLGRGMSVDLAPGIILGTSQYSRSYAPGFNGQVALNLNTWLSMTSTLQVIRMHSEERQPNFPFAVIATQKPVTSWFVGVRVGALPGVVAGSALGALSLLWAAAFRD